MPHHFLNFILSVPDRPNVVMMTSEAIIVSVNLNKFSRWNIRTEGYNLYSKIISYMNVCWHVLYYCVPNLNMRRVEV